MILHDVKQGAEEWLALRAGIPTASELDNLPSQRSLDGGRASFNRDADPLPHTGA